MLPRPGRGMGVGNSHIVIASPSLAVILREQSDRRISLRVNSANLRAEGETTHIVIATPIYRGKQSYRNVLEQYTPLKLASGGAKISI